MATINKNGCISLNQIEQYINNTATDEDRNAIEKHTLNCEFCEVTLEVYLNDPTQIQKAKLLQQEFEQSLIQQKQTKKTIPLFRRLSGIAAAVLLLIVASTCLVYWSSGQNNRLANSFLNKKEMPSIEIGLRGEGDENDEKIDRNLKHALSLYVKKDYKNAFYNLKEYLQDHPNHILATYFSGLAALEINELDDAEIQLDYVAKRSEEHKEDATWYLALTKIKLNKKEEAKVLISAILQNEDSYYFEEATQLLAILNQ